MGEIIGLLIKLKGNLSNDEWTKVKERLVELSENPENVVQVTADENGVVRCIFIQLASQRKVYQTFGEVLELDGAHKLTKLGMPLYTLMVQDSWGLGQPAAFFFVREETTENIKIGLSALAEVIQCCSVHMHLLVYLNFSL